MAIAKYSGHCPLCSKYIAKSRSKIRALPKAIPLRSHCGRSSLDDGNVYNYDGKQIYDWETPRLWVHEACFPRLNDPLPEVERCRWEYKGCRL